MPQVLFLVHGMGDHPPGWSAEVITLLDELLAQYPGSRGSTKPFSDHVAIEEISYDAIFDQHIRTWGQNVDALAQFAREHGIALPKTLTLLSGGSLTYDEKSFVWETLLDPVLYRAAAIVRNNVRAAVLKQILERWDWYLRQRSRNSEPVNVHFLCHSQGTIVASDVLAHIGEARTPDCKPFAADKQAIASLTTVANVTRLGPKALIDIDSLKSVVRPRSAPKAKQSLPNYLLRMVNVRHKWDPFVWWQMFDPTGWGKNYQLVDDLRHFHLAFPHSFTHYLKHPRVHIEFFRTVLGHERISSAAETAALAAFRDVTVPGACGDVIARLQAELQALASKLGPESGLDDFIANAVKVHKVAKQAHEACAQLPLGV